MFIQIIVTIFVLFMLFKIAGRYKQGVFTIPELIFWFVFWLAADAVVIMPQTTSFLASRVGIGRGVDLVVYVSILALFYAIFKMTVKLKKIEEDITNLVRIQAIKHSLSKDKVELESKGGLDLEVDSKPDNIIKVDN